MHKNSVGQIPPQGGLQAYREETSLRQGRSVYIPPSGGRDVGGRTAGGGDLRLTFPEYSHKFYCDQDHYVPVSSGEAETGATGIQVEVGAVNIGCGGNAAGGLGGGTDKGGGGDGQDSNRDGRLIRWEYTVANAILGTGPNAPIAYALLLELHRYY